MKFVHISDLHIGKRLNEYSLIDDQRHILNEIIKIIQKEKPDAVFIAGDVYDKTMPSAEAVALLDEFLLSLSKNVQKTFIISGNHDSAERIAYGAGIFEKQGIYLSQPYEGEVKKAEIIDEYGKINIYLLPFIKPANVKRYFEEVETYTDALHAVINSLDIEPGERNIIIAHQFVTGAERRDSEEVTVGGLDNVDSFVFDKFDYVALGHIHTCQKIKKDTIRYSGTPMKYSASEACDKKCVIVGEIKEKGNVIIQEIPLVPLRDFLDLKGTLDYLTERENKNDYVRITLTDEETVVDAYGKLKNCYPYMTEILFERKTNSFVENREFSQDKSMVEKFCDFYCMINGKELTEEQIKEAEAIYEEITEDRI